MDDELRRAIELRAYTLWEEAGRPEGREMEFWFAAEEEIGAPEDPGNQAPYVDPDDIPPDDIDQGEFRRREDFTDEPLSGADVNR